MQLNEVCLFLDQFAPTALAEEWDNVGLLVGDADAKIKKLMTCLTITPESADEAISGGADLIVTHHPLPFRPIQKITTKKTPTKLLWRLIQNQIAIYSPHTGFDSAEHGINQKVCERLGLTEIEPLVPNSSQPENLGSGRLGRLAPSLPVSQFLELVKQKYKMDRLRFVGKLENSVTKVASACGSGGSFLSAAVKNGCDALVTGECDFHSCLEAAAQNLTLVLVGHHNSERFALELLAESLSEKFKDLEVWASKQESDPILWA